MIFSTLRQQYFHYVHILHILQILQNRQRFNKSVILGTVDNYYADTPLYVIQFFSVLVGC